MAAENFKVKKGLEVGTGITANSDGINITGVITAVQYKGDGSGLTGVVGSGSGVVVKDEGSAVGTAGTINFVGTGVVATLSAGIATVTVSSGGLDNVVEDTTPELGGNLDLNSKFITGSGGINVTGVVTASSFSGPATQVAVSDESSSISCFPLFVTASVTGGLVQAANLAPKAGSNLSFDSANGGLVATKFTGSTVVATGHIEQISASGISTFTGAINAGVTTTTNLSAQQLNVSGITTLGSGASGSVVLKHGGNQKLTL